MKRLIKFTGILLLILMLLALVGLKKMGNDSENGSAIGLVNGVLSACPHPGNCVCSEYPDSPGYVEPIPYPEAGKQALLNAIEATGGRVKHNENNYVSATYRIPVFGFIDDVEFRLDASGGVIQVRSASRTGYSDLGVNKRRVTRIRKALEK